MLILSKRNKQKTKETGYIPYSNQRQKPNTAKDKNSPREFQLMLETLKIENNKSVI